MSIMMKPRSAAQRPLARSSVDRRRHSMSKMAAGETKSWVVPGFAWQVGRSAKIPSQGAI